MTKKNDGTGKELVVKICGECVKVNRTDNFRETCKKLLVEKGVNVYSIFLDGKEVDATTILPETFEQCQTVEVARQVTAGKNKDFPLVRVQVPQLAIDYIRRKALQINIVPVDTKKNANKPAGK